MVNKKPVILQVLRELRSGGVERGTVEIANAIVQAGGISLVASGGGNMVTQLQKIGATHITLPLASKNPFTIWLNSWRLSSIIRKHKVDIIHARSRAPAWSAYLAAQRSRCHFVTTFHGTYGIQNEWKRKYNSIMTRGKIVIAISHFIANHIQQNYEISPEKLRIIHRGVDLQLFNPNAHKARNMIDLAREWRLPEEFPLILFPGRFARWKGQDVFIDAFAHAFGGGNERAIILGGALFGEHDYAAGLQRQIAALGLQERVELVGFHADVTPFLQRADVLVHASLLAEPFGQVVIEGLAAGVPVIAADAGGPTEIIEHGRTGLLVQPGDRQALAAAMRQLASDVALRERLSRAGLEHAKQFTPERVAALMNATYSAVLTKSR